MRKKKKTMIRRDGETENQGPLKLGFVKVEKQQRDPTLSNPRNNLPTL